MRYDIKLKLSIYRISRSYSRKKKHVQNLLQIEANRSQRITPINHFGPNRSP
jgi:hypothetical protein